MNDMHDKDVLIEIGGKPLKMRFDIKAIRIAESRLGELAGETKPRSIIKWFKDAERDSEGVSITELIAVFWATIQRHHKDITEEWLAENILLPDFANIARSINIAFLKNMPAAEKKITTPTASDPTGSTI